MNYYDDHHHPPAANDRLKTISVIELDFHQDCLDSFLKIFHNTNIRINVFTTAKILSMLKNIRYSDNIKFYKYSGGSKFLFLRKHALLINSAQVIFIGTIANDFGAYLALDNSVPIVLRVHNVNKQFRPLTNISIPKSLFSAWKSTSYIMRQILGKGFLIFRPFINRKVNYFTFPDETISHYVKSLKLADDKKILPSIPLRICLDEDQNDFEEFSETLNVTIIGVTDRRRRRYEEVIEALQRLYSLSKPPIITLNLLGDSNNAYGKKIMEQLKRITHPGFSFNIYKTRVSEEEFSERMKQTHLIISPVTADATTDIFKEIYGKTKTTGSVLDFLKFGKLTLIPYHYSVSEELSEFVINYNNPTHLSEIILDLVQNKKINTLNRKSLCYIRENYSRKTALKSTLNIFNSIIENE